MLLRPKASAIHQIGLLALTVVGMVRTRSRPEMTAPLATGLPLLTRKATRVVEERTAGGVVVHATAFESGRGAGGARGGGSAPGPLRARGARGRGGAGEEGGEGGGGREKPPPPPPPGAPPPPG